MKIWKYKLELTDVQFLKMPYRNQILSIQRQDEQICMWALVDEKDIDLINKKITIIGTGNDIGEGPGLFIGTVQSNGFVWHVFIQDG